MASSVFINKVSYYSSHHENQLFRCNLFINFNAILLITPTTSPLLKLHTNKLTPDQIQKPLHFQRKLSFSPTILLHYCTLRLFIRPGSISYHYARSSLNTPQALYKLRYRIIYHVLNATRYAIINSPANKIKMPTFFFLSLVMHLLSISTSSQTVPNRISVATEWTSRKLENEPCRSGNPIDDCWRCDPEWETNRKRLADCAIGFGRNAVGGRDGELYVVTDPSDDPVNPVKGTLRYGAIQNEPLWIIFDHDMDIKLKEELVMNSYKTIDGRGHSIQIAGGPCITIQGVSNIIIHNIYVRDCVTGGNAIVRDSPDHAGLRGYSDGDGISMFGARDVWIDHCTLANCSDGLIDAINGSTAITISNNYMLDHNEVMLMGHSDDFDEDKNMQVTIAFNFFGEGLTQRMPRCRFGYFHIVNNIYTGWEMYAIGGSANPTINSQGNVFIASNNESTKEVTKRETSPEDEEWKNWNWRSDGDIMINGAYFTPSGDKGPASYIKASSMVARPATLLTNVSPSSGALNCQSGQPC